MLVGTVNGLDGMVCDGNLSPYLKGPLLPTFQRSLRVASDGWKVWTSSPGLLHAHVASLRTGLRARGFVAVASFFFPLSASFLEGVPQHWLWVSPVSLLFRGPQWLLSPCFQPHSSRGVLHVSQWSCLQLSALCESFGEKLENGRLKLEAVAHVISLEEEEQQIRPRPEPPKDSSLPIHTKRRSVEECFLSAGKSCVMFRVPCSVFRVLCSVFCVPCPCPCPWRA